MMDSPVSSEDSDRSSDNEVDELVSSVYDAVKSRVQEKSTRKSQPNLTECRKVNAQRSMKKSSTPSHLNTKSKQAKSDEAAFFVLDTNPSPTDLKLTKFSKSAPVYNTRSGMKNKARPNCTPLSTKSGSNGSAEESLGFLDEKQNCTLTNSNLTENTNDSRKCHIKSNTKQCTRNNSSSTLNDKASASLVLGANPTLLPGCSDLCGRTNSLPKKKESERGQNTTKKDSKREWSMKNKGSDADKDILAFVIDTRPGPVPADVNSPDNSSTIPGKFQKKYISQNKNEGSSSDIEIVPFVIDKTPGPNPVGVSTDIDIFDVQDIPVPYFSTETNPKDSDVEDEFSRKESTKRHEKKYQERKQKSLELSSSLSCDIDLSKIYVSFNSKASTKDSAATLQHQARQPILDKKKELEIMKKSVITEDFEKQSSIQGFESLRQQKKQRKAEREKTKGRNWFNMPATELSDERKHDLTVLHMRRALDPKRFYKGNDSKAPQKYFQFGTVVESPADFYHSRIPKKQRKSTMVDELLTDAEFRRYNKRKYVEIQEAKRLGQGPYKRMKRLKKNKR